MCRLQKQMKIMNRNLTGKLEEMNGMQNVDTHVALSGELQIHVKYFTKTNIFSLQKYVVSYTSSPEGRLLGKRPRPVARN